MLLQSMAMVAKILLADDKITACAKNKYVSWVYYVKIRKEKHCLVKDFAFLKNVCYQYYNFVL